MEKFETFIHYSITFSQMEFLKFIKQFWCVVFITDSTTYPASMAYPVIIYPWLDQEHNLNST